MVEVISLGENRYSLRFEGDHGRIFIWKNIELSPSGTVKNILALEVSSNKEPQEVIHFLDGRFSGRRILFTFEKGREGERWRIKVLDENFEVIEYLYPASTKIGGDEKVALVNQIERIIRVKSLYCRFDVLRTYLDTERRILLSEALHAIGAKLITTEEIPDGIRFFFQNSESPSSEKNIIDISLQQIKNGKGFNEIFKMFGVMKNVSQPTEQYSSNAYQS